MKKAAVLTIAVLVFAGCSPGGEKAAGSPVIAAVNGVPITAAQLKEKVELLHPVFENVSGRGDPGVEAKKDLLSQLIEESMLLQEAARLGITATEGELDRRMEGLKADYPEGMFKKTIERDGLSMKRFREELGKKIVIEKLVDSEVYSKITVDRDMALKYYEENRSRFNRPMMVRVRQIVVDSEREARAIHDELDAGASFEDLAVARSFSPDSAAGGDLGYFARGEMPPEFEAVVFGMKPGETSGVVKTPYGYHIFRLEDVREAENPRFEQVVDKVKRMLRADIGEDRFKAWQKRLSERTKIEVDLDALDRI